MHNKFKDDWIRPKGSPVAKYKYSNKFNSGLEVTLYTDAADNRGGHGKDYGKHVSYTYDWNSINGKKAFFPDQYMPMDLSEDSTSL